LAEPSDLTVSTVALALSTAGLARTSAARKADAEGWPRRSAY
jgi:hypothetical protein